MLIKRALAFILEKKSSLKYPVVEGVDTIRERIDRVRTVVPDERLFVHPDSGLNALSTKQADAKLAALAEAVSKGLS